MELAYRGAREAIADGKSPDDIARAAKVSGAFAGSLRGNLVRMLDEIGMPQSLGITSSADLFGGARELLHTASAVRYPVFLGTQHYTGSPSPEKSPLLMTFVREVLTPELESVSRALIVPLGKSVEGVLNVLAKEGRIRPERWLSGFPHPSGANGHRVRTFNDNRRSLGQQMGRIFGNNELLPHALAAAGVLSAAAAAGCVWWFDGGGRRRPPQQKRRASRNPAAMRRG